MLTETLRTALEELANANEEWRAPLVTVGWAERYGRPVHYDRLPRSKEKLAAHVLQVGEDGMSLLRAVHQEGAPSRLRHQPKVQVLRRVWVQRFWYDAAGQLGRSGPKDGHDRLSRRDAPRHSDGPGGGSPGIGTARVPWSREEIVTPHDAEARFAHRPGKAAWIGYKDHQTETCDGTGPNVIVHVATQPAPEQDVSVLETIHHALGRRALLPAEHPVDSGYVTPATILRTTTAYGITVLGPVRLVSPRQHRPGFDKKDFHIDWDRHTATCPRGVTSPPWKTTRLDGQTSHSVLFPRAACRECADRQSCTGNTDGRGRHLILMPRPLQEIQNRARIEQETLAWRARHAMRAGCEATDSETVHAHGLRQCRYRGLAKVHVQHVLTAAGANVVRLSGCFPPRNCTTQARTAAHTVSAALPEQHRKTWQLTILTKDHQQHPLARATFRSTRPSVRAASSQRHTVRTFTPPTWAPARTCAAVNAPAASSSSTGLDTLNPAVTSPHTPGSPTPHPPDAQTRRRPPCRRPTPEGSEVPFPRQRNKEGCTAP